MPLLEVLKQEKIVAILRGIPQEKGDLIADALVKGGILLMEVTMNTDGALQMISRWREKLPSEIRIGAGTVLDVEMAEQAVKAGAEFIISPNLDEEVIAYCMQEGVAVWPGTMTPTEIVKAWKLGASAVKVFPSGSLGPGYIKEIRAPLNQIPMIATGGISLDNIGDYLKAGVAGVGLGGNLVSTAAVREGRYEDIEKNAAAFVQAVRKEGQ